MDHHVADLQLAQVENAADHVAMFALDRALLVMQIDRAADFLVSLYLCNVLLTHAEERQHMPDDVLNGVDYRRQDTHDKSYGRSDGQCETIRASDGQRLRQY